MPYFDVDYEDLAAAIKIWLEAPQFTAMKKVFREVFTSVTSEGSFSGGFDISKVRVLLPDV